ncbi:MAG: glycerophosphodiester phosphodiesterase [Streptococcaceae bacterium]|nr:glycerophosphodiester phosphodiesterase [Streptococcaceae bacterium]
MKFTEFLLQLFKHEVGLIKSDSETLIFAHRGSKCNRPENTLAAFEEAVQVASDGIELDVHLSKDQELMVIHDETIDRTTTGNGRVRDFTRRELQAFDAGVTFDGHFKGQRIPTLTEVLKLLTRLNFTGVLNIEIKTDKYNYPEIEKILSVLMTSQKWVFSYIYCSFNFETLRRMSEIEPETELCYLTFDNDAEIQRGLRADFIGAIHPKKTFVFKHRIRSRHAIKPLRTWTLNTEAEMREAFKLQLAGFMTDFPELALKIKRTYLKSQID